MQYFLLKTCLNGLLQINILNTVSEQIKFLGLLRVVSSKRKQLHQI